MILQADHLKKSFADQEVLRDAAFLINEGDRWVLLGRNGGGKTTLFRILAGEMECDGGSVILSKGKSVAHLPQFSPSDEGVTPASYVAQAFGELRRMEERIHHLEKAMEGEYDDRVFSEYTEVLEIWRAKGGERIDVSVREQLGQLGFSPAQMDGPVAHLSGGQKQKVYLARLALTQADLLLLDEPTNHLDLTAVAWLEEFLLDHRGASIIISHDVQFVRRLATRLIHLSNGKTELFYTGYDGYVEESKARNEALAKKIEEQDTFLKKNLAYVAKFGAGTRSTQAQSRLKMIERVELLDAPVSEKTLRGLRFPVDEELPKDVLKVRHLAVGYPGHPPVLKDLSFDIIKNECIAILGRNGCGKTTLLRSLMEQIPPLSGTIRFGARIVPCLFDQEQRTLDSKMTILDFFQERYPQMKQEEVRTKLGTFLFSGDSVFDNIGVLSGGERGRLQMLDLLLQKPNLLILDEPTNNLDLSSVSVLTASLKAYEGALILISHDRELVAKVATRLLVIAGGKLHNLPGTWAEHRHTVEALLRGEDSLSGLSHTPAATANSKAPPVLPEVVPKGNVPNPKKKMNRFKVKEIEDRIAALEEEKATYESALLLTPPQDFAQMKALHGRLEDVQSRMAQALAQWEALHEEAKE